MNRKTASVRRYARVVAREFLVNRMIASVLVPIELRWRLLRIAGLEIAPCGVAERVWFGGRTVSIGRGTFVNVDCFFDGETHIGERCNVGYGVMFCSITHRKGNSSRRAGAVRIAPIIVEDGCWIGARSLILPGVRVGTGSVIGAGSIVTRDVAANTMIVGSPARTVRALD